MVFKPTLPETGIGRRTVYVWMRIDAHIGCQHSQQRTRSTLSTPKSRCTGLPVCVSMRAQTGSLGRSQLSHSPYKHQLPALQPCRPGVAKALANDRHGNGDGMARLFTQHKLLMGSGFSYDQASLILQVSQQRKAASQLLASGAAASDPELNTPRAAAAAPPPASGPDSPSATDSAPAMPPVLKTLEERIAFLEMEVLKQSLAATTLPTTGLLPDGNTKDSSRMASGTASSSFRGTAAALNPVGAGAGGLNAAAAAAANRWNADSVMYKPQWYKQPSPPFGNGSGDLQGPAPDANALSISTQLAAAAELGQLDPEVYTIAEALAVRQGFAGLPPEPYALSPQQQQPRRPSSIWGRSVHHSRPLSANAWGGPTYEPGYGEPLLTRQELDEEVPYHPTGWAVAGTIVTVYLGVLVTFLALCVGDMPY